jgi:hypothetical protein
MRPACVSSSGISSSGLQAPSQAPGSSSSAARQADSLSVRTSKEEPPASEHSAEGSAESQRTHDLHPNARRIWASRVAKHATNRHQRKLILKLLDAWRDASCEAFLQKAAADVFRRNALQNRFYAPGKHASPTSDPCLSLSCGSALSLSRRNTHRNTQEHMRALSRLCSLSPSLPLSKPSLSPSLCALSLFLLAVPCVSLSPLCPPPLPCPCSQRRARERRASPAPVSFRRHCSAGSAQGRRAAVGHLLLRKGTLYRYVCNCVCCITHKHTHTQTHTHIHTHTHTTSSPTPSHPSARDRV